MINRSEERRVGKSVDLGRNTSNGKQYCTFTMATSDKYQGHDGEWREDTEWHKIKVYGRGAERISNQVKKGSTVYVDGQITSYEAEGARRVEIKAFKVLVIKSKDTTDIATSSDQFLSPSKTSKLDPWKAEPENKPWAPSGVTWGG